MFIPHWNFFFININSLMFSFWWVLHLPPSVHRVRVVEPRSWLIARGEARYGISLFSFYYIMPPFSHDKLWTDYTIISIIPIKQICGYF